MLASNSMVYTIGAHLIQMGEIWVLTVFGVESPRHRGEGFIALIVMISLIFPNDVETVERSRYLL
jgi:hypothetical protein